MSHESSSSGGWLPPRAPGSQEPPHFERARPEAPPTRAGGWTPPQVAGHVQPRPGPPAQRGEQPVFAQPENASSNGLAIASLVLGVAGLVVLLFTLGLGFFISLVCSGAAWVLAIAARRRVRAGTASGGEGQAKAGLYLGIAGVILGVLAMIVWIALLASGFDLQEWQRELERELDRQQGGESGRLSLLRAAAGSLLGPG